MSVIDSLADLGKTVARFAPALGKVLPIPGGAILGEIIAEQFGGDIKNPDELTRKIVVDPDAQLKLMQIQHDYELEINKIRLQWFTESNKDKDSARNREVEFAKSGRVDNTPRNLAYTTTVGFLVLVFLMPFLPVDGNEKEIMMVLVGMIASKFGSIIDYYFGSAIDSALSNLGNISKLPIGRKKKNEDMDVDENYPRPTIE